MKIKKKIKLASMPFLYFIEIMSLRSRTWGKFVWIVIFLFLCEENWSLNTSIYLIWYQKTLHTISYAICPTIEYTEQENRILSQIISS